MKAGTLGSSGPLAVIVALATVAAACWLLVAAYSKIGEFTQFVAAVRQHGLVPPAQTVPFAALAIAFEAACAVVALWSVLHRRPGIGAIAAGVCFLGIAGYCLALAASPPPAPAPCGCGWLRSTVERWEPLAAQNATVGSSLPLGGVLSHRARRPNDRPLSR